MYIFTRFFTRPASLTGITARDKRVHGMIDNTTYFIYGLSIMFYFMTSLLFYWKGNERLSRLVMILMAITGTECVIDMFFFDNGEYLQPEFWQELASCDMIALPIYAFILQELYYPGRLTARSVILNFIPFIVFPVVIIITNNQMIYNIELGFVLVYAMWQVVKTLYNIPLYHKRLKESFSYDKNINLNWLRIVLVSFIVIFSLWIISCLWMDLNIEKLYLVVSLLMWMFTCYFIYKHETVLDELRSYGDESDIADDGDETATLSEIERQMQQRFIAPRLYLNPRLRLSDVAAIVGTNRTYLSRFFNQEKGLSFYDYINGLRTDHAEKLLAETQERLAKIAEMSGFNSLSTFRRAFATRHHCTPAEYRRIARQKTGCAE